MQLCNGQLFIKVDSTYIAIGSSNFTYALDIYVKCFCVLNVKYPEQSDCMFNFLELIYDVSPKKLPILLELEQSIINFVLTVA